MHIYSSLGRFVAVVILLAALSGCNSKQKVYYFQDLTVDVPEVARDAKFIKVEPGDKISIYVSSSDPSLAAIFNLTQVNNNNMRDNMGASTGGMRNVTTTQNTSLYTVSPQGNIDFPILGQLHVAGLTRQEIVEMIKDRLIKGKFISDPVVTVEFANLHFTIIGEAKSPQVYSISNDRLNIIEALAMAGDLPPTAERDQIYVIRTEDGVRTTMQVDIRTKEIFNSPAYDIKQNDIIYIVPNSKKAGEYSINENSWKSVSMYLGVASFLMSVTGFVIALTR